MNFSTIPFHSIELMENLGLGLEAALERDEKRPEFKEHFRFVKSFHLPFSDINYAAIDAEEREVSLQRTISAMEKAAEFGIRKVVLHPLGIWELNGKHVGEYDIFVDTMRKLVPVAEKLNLLVCVENMVLRNPAVNVRYATTVEEWWGVLDLLQSNAFKLTLDTSHAASNAQHGNTYEERTRNIWHYLDRPELIAHVHLSDARMMEGLTKYEDTHMLPGKGDIPRDFIKAVLQLPVSIVLEQKCTDSECAESLDFLSQLNTN